MKVSNIKVESLKFTLKQSQKVGLTRGHCYWCKKFSEGILEVRCLMFAHEGDSHSPVICSSVGVSVVNYYKVRV